MSLDFDRVKRLHESSNGQDKAEISLHHNAVLSRMSTYKDKPTRANKIDWDAAKEGLVECVDRLWSKYFPEDTVTPDPQRFERQKDALEWLRAKGYKVSGGKFSNDWNGGKVKVHQGGVSFAALLEYAATLDVDHKKIANSEQRAAIKEGLEIKLLEEKLRRAELENRRDDDRWSLKEEAEAHEAALMGVLADTFRHRVYLDHGMLLQAAGGDQERSPEFARALQDFVNSAFNEVADGRQFEVEFEGEDDEL